MTNRIDGSDLAPGVVLHSAPGQPAFPVRLAVELFRRARHDLGRERVTLWDPMCGSGYLLTVLGLLERPNLDAVLGTDVSDDALGLAERNLALLAPDGLDERADERRRQAEEFAKPQYEESALAAERLRERLVGDGGALPARTAAASVLDPEALRAALDGLSPDLVVTDVPYGERVSWSDVRPGEDPVVGALDALASVLPEDAAIVLCTRGRRVPTGSHPTRWRLKVGTRSAAMLRVADIRR